MRGRIALAAIAVAVVAVGAAFAVRTLMDDSDESSPSNVASATPAFADASPPAGETPAAASLASLASFEYRFVVSGDIPQLAGLAPQETGILPPGDLVLTGAYDAEADASRLDITAGGADFLGLVVIGEQEWARTQGAWIGPSEATASAIESVPVVTFWDEGFLVQTAPLPCVGPSEELTGVAVVHCTFGLDDLVTYPALADYLGVGDPATDLSAFALDMWLAADGGYPVRFVMQGSTSDGTAFGIDMEVTNIGQPVAIEPPL